MNEPTPALILQIEVTSTPERRAELLSIARMILGPLSALPGCDTCRCFEGMDNGPLMLSVQWRSHSELHAYIASDAFLRTLEWMELSATTPEIRLSSVVHEDGMDMICSIRELKGRGRRPT